MRDEPSHDDRPFFLPELRGPSPLPQPLVSVAGMLEHAWVETVVARRSRQLWDRIAPSLGSYNDATQMLRMWHRDSLLSSCRRLVDRTPRTSSVRRALIVLQRHAESVDEDLLARLIVSLGHADETEPNMFDEARRRLRDAVTGAGSQYRGQLTKRTVSADLDRLDIIEEPIVKMVNHVIAHRSAGPSDIPSLEFETVDAFILEMQDIVGRWIHLLRGISPIGAVQYVFGSAEMVDALRLHDAEAYRAAKSEVRRSLPNGTTSEDRAAAFNAIGVRYERPDLLG